MIPPAAEVQSFLHFLLQVVQSQSLVVSIPVLVTWTKLLNNRSLGPSIAKSSLVASLLEVCSSRLVRYESLPEDTEDPTLLLLMEDTDTIPERHAFLGNYRRYSSQVIESIVELTLSDAINHILGQTENVLQHMYDGLPPFNPANYAKNSMPYLRVDAQFTVIESALKGYVRSRPPKGASQDQIDMQRAQLDGHLAAWCNRLIEMKFEDPLIRKRVLQLLVAFSTTALRKNNGFMLKVLEHILMTWPAAQPEHKLFNEAIKDLQAESINELQRLAFKMPDNLLAVYDQLDNKIQEMSASGTLDERRLVNYKSFLFIIIHRASNLDQDIRLQRLQMFVEPVKAQWRDEGLKRALESYQGFCELIGLDKAQKYLAKHGVNRLSDWGAVELDAEGSALQAELEERQQVHSISPGTTMECIKLTLKQMLPLRATKTFLNYSVDKLEKSTPAWQASCALWQDSFPVILPRLLEFLA
jgi:exportin-5